MQTMLYSWPMTSADQRKRQASGRRALVSVAVALVLVIGLVAGCVVDSTVIETTQGTPQAGTESTPTSAVPTDATPTVGVLFEPTVTATPTPAATPTATTPPEPTATEVPAGPTPLPTTDPTTEFAPTPVAPGLVAVPVRGASFMLDQSRPVLQLGGHTLIYLDDERTAEVDIFTPVADRDGNPLVAYSDVIDYIASDAAFGAIQELTPVSIAGLATRVFEGTAAATERAFVTELGATSEQLGWFPPARMRLWFIDHPDGPVVVSAESLEDPGRYSDAVRLATEVLSTIDFD